MKKMLKIVLIILAVLLSAGSAAFYALYRACQPELPEVENHKIHIACIGDSITFGTGVPFSRKKDAWTFQLDEMLDEDYQVLNYGIGGATLCDIGDHPYRSYGFLEEAIKVNPEYMLFMLGTNDSKPYNWDEEEYKEELKRFVLQIKNESPGTELIIMIPTKAFADKNGKTSFDISNEVISKEITPILKEIAQEYNLKLIDLYSLSEDSTEFFKDGIHPDKDGNKMIAEYLKKELSDIMH